MRIKICGLTRLDQAVAIASMGASVLGFICVKQSPRYVTPDVIETIAQALPPIDRFGVFANAPLEEIQPAYSFMAKSRLPTVKKFG